MEGTYAKVAGDLPRDIDERGKRIVLVSREFIGHGLTTTVPYETLVFPAILCVVPLEWLLDLLRSSGRCVSRGNGPRGSTCGPSPCVQGREPRGSCRFLRFGTGEPRFTLSVQNVSRAHQKHQKRTWPQAGVIISGGFREVLEPEGQPRPVQ